MRICLVAHGFPPEERTGVEGYTDALARALCEAGHGVEVFVPRPDPVQADLAMRRAEHRTPSGRTFGVTRIATNRPPRDPVEALDPPGVAARFGELLDRERPEVVHFQHVIKLGLGLVEACAERGIPTVYTAHDYYGACHRYTLLRPDLTVCTVEADPDACARCDLALSILNDAAGGRDYQMGLAPGDLEEATARRLVGTLSGDPVDGGGFDPGEWAVARERRRTLDERRARVLGSVDLLLAPSRFLGERLARSLPTPDGPKAWEHLRYGTEVEDLVGLRTTAPVGAHGGPLRLAYLGGLAKHKGVEVLLEAFGRLREAHGGAVELAVHGYSSDGAWVERLEAQAAAVGARWCGGYQRPDLPGLLAETDLVVVPSTWYENYPIVIREALAAGRPVVTSDLGAMPESVRDGVDGALFEPGSAEDLARVLSRVVTERALLSTWAAAIEPVHTMEDQAEELVARYRLLAAAADEQRAAAEGLDDLPASMAAFVGRLAELERAPTRDLFTRAVAGIGELAATLGIDPDEQRADRVLASAFRAGDEAQRSLRDQRREVDWLRTSLAGQAEGQTELERRCAWLEATLADRDEALEAMRAERDEARRGRTAEAERAAWLEGEVAGRDETVAAKDEALAQKDAALAGQLEELEWRRGLVVELEAERERLAAHLAELEQLLAEQAAALGLHEGRIDELVAGLEAAHAERIELEALLHQRLHEVAEVGRLALAGQEHAMVRGLAPLFEALDRASGHGPEPSRESIERGLADLVTAVERGLVRLAVLEAELAWRRDEMTGLVDEAGRFPLRLLFGRTGAGKRAKAWGAAEAPTNDGEVSP